jgi:peptidoglycan-N-acetylglucosamine deacetylase
LHFLLTIDVEDWFQVENLRPWFPHETWSGCELRVERNVNRLLDLFDELSSKFSASNSVNPTNPINSINPTNPINPINSTNPVNCLNATFFTLGWIAERLPHLVREIASRGHEVASHGYSHRMCSPLPDGELREDLVKSKRILEDILGEEVAGFRAPNFSVDDRVLKLVAEAGYSYDSSYNNFDLHGRYGKITLNGQPKAGIAYQLDDGFFELPISNLPLSCLPILGTLFNLTHFKAFISVFKSTPPSSTLGTLAHSSHFRHSNRVLPWGGGAYFRLVPQFIFMSGVRRILNRSGAYSFYMHPWEIDPGQPKVEQAPFISRFKHYTNLEKAEKNFRGLLGNFSDCLFSSCRDYIQLNHGSRKGSPPSV